MKKYTQIEFDNLPLIGTSKQCPTGDYTEIVEFEDGIVVSGNCVFGVNSRFGDYCKFGANCKFGNACRFGQGCILKEHCRFGDKCRFGDDCKFNGPNTKPGNPFITIGGIGGVNRTTFFSNQGDIIRVRSGTFFGTIDEFQKSVICYNTPQCLAMADLAKSIFYPSQIKI